MIDEEKYIRDRFGSASHFRVPEGYFDDFASRLMDRLPERKNPSAAVSRRLRPFLYAAACLCVAMFSAVIYYFDRIERGENMEGNVAAVRSHGGEAAYFDSDDVVEYAMMDNADIYSYLSGE